MMAERQAFDRRRIFFDPGQLLTPRVGARVRDQRREIVVNRSRFAVNGDEITANAADSWRTLPIHDERGPVRGEWARARANAGRSP